MILTLERPLVWIDVETHDHGYPEDVHICEIGFEVVYPDKSPLIWSTLVKPPMPITPIATFGKDGCEGHGITNEMVADAKPWSYFAKNLADHLVNVDFAGYHVKSFDLRCIKAEMFRAGVEWSYDGAYVVDGLRIWQKAHPRGLADAVREFLKREPTAAHRVAGDVLDARETTEAMLERFSQLPRSVKALHDLCFPPETEKPQNPNWIDSKGKLKWINGEAHICTGKWAKPNPTPIKVMLEDHQPKWGGRAYLEWTLTDSFGDDFKTFIRNALNGHLPTQPKE